MVRGVKINIKDEWLSLSYSVTIIFWKFHKRALFGQNNEPRSISINKHFVFLKTPEILALKFVCGIYFRQILDSLRFVAFLVCSVWEENIFYWVVGFHWIDTKYLVIIISKKGCQNIRFLRGFFLAIKMCTWTI